MYVLLRGQITVYHNYGTLGDDSVDVTSSESTDTDDECRQRLGAFVVSLNGQSDIIDHFSGTARAVGLVFPCVCVSEQ